MKHETINSSKKGKIGYAYPASIYYDIELFTISQVIRS